MSVQQPPTIFRGNMIKTLAGNVVEVDFVEVRTSMAGGPPSLRRMPNAADSTAQDGWLIYDDKKTGTRWGVPAWILTA